MGDQQQTHASPTSDGNDFAMKLQSDLSNDERLALMQQIFQQKQAELFAQFQCAQTSLALQQYNYFLAIEHNRLQQNQNQNITACQPQSETMNSIETSEDSDNQQVSPIPREPSGMRIRRTLSGSGQTISQLTRDRLKSMITTKMNRNRADGSNSSSSHSSDNGSRIIAMPSMQNAWANETERSATQKHLSNSAIPSTVVSSSHFEPYPVPSTMHAIHNSLPSVYQLRKVNSEPNLKMRIRAKLLSKGSSPVQNNQNSSFTFPQHALQRSDSDVPMDGSLGPNTPLEQQNQFFPTSHLIIPSPSLPNLPSPNHVQMDMSALLAQAAHSPFFSMPSLLKNNLITSPVSMIDSMLDPAVYSEGGRHNQTLKFDSRTLNSPLPFGGYPSLLKQQLRDLVLRRKSLVREEPEDEVSLETQLVSRNYNRTVSNLGNSPLKTGLVYDTLMARHQCVCGNDKNHVEHGGRVQTVWAALIENGLVDRCERIASRKASLDSLKTAHSLTYVTFFAISPTACLKIEPSQLPVKSFIQLPCGGIGIDSDTYFNDASTQLAARLAAGSLIELTSQIAEGKVRNGFACIRPPGHHSEYDQAMGFCFFNNVAIAAKYLQQRYRDLLPRLAIIDWDVHHGNGTQLCFETDPSVLYISLHRHDNGNFFPGTGAVTEVGIEAGKGFTVNIPFSGEMMDDADYLAAWRVIVTPVLDQFNPNFILVSAGFDAARGHSQALGGYNLSPQLFGYFTKQLMCYANGRVVLALEGGYDLKALSECAAECVKVLYGDEAESCGKLSDEALNSLPKQSAQEAIQKVVAIHKKHWSSLSASQGIGMSELHWQTVAHRFASLSV